MKPSVLVVAALVISATGFIAFKFAEPEQNSFAIEYKVDCKTCEVTFRDEKGNSQDVPDANSAWTYKFTGEKGQFIYVSAMDTKGEPVKVTILKDGQEFTKDESATAYVSARAGSIL